MMGKDSDTDLYLGSLNASYNAAYGNVEFMIKLRSKNGDLKMDKLKDSIFGDNETDSPFQEVTLHNAIIDEEDTKQNLLDGIIKDIVRSNPQAVATQQGEDAYSLAVHFDAVDTKECQAVIRPLLSKKAADFETDILFSGLSVTQLSKFYSISVSDGEYKTERVLIIPTSGLPGEREKAVVSSVVSNRDYFYRYVAFLLGDDAILSVLESNAIEGNGMGGHSPQNYKTPALYEKMLQTAATDPEKFKGIEYLMKTISEDGIIPEDFRKLYDTFQKAVKFSGSCGRPT
jgi:hypothetical protein